MGGGNCRASHKGKHLLIRYSYEKQDLFQFALPFTTRRMYIYIYMNEIQIESTVSPTVNINKCEKSSVF